MRKPSAVKGEMCSPTRRNEAVHVSGCSSEGVFYFLPKDLNFSFYAEISHVAFCLRGFCFQLCTFLGVLIFHHAAPSAHCSHRCGAEGSRACSVVPTENPNVGLWGNPTEEMLFIFLFSSKFPLVWSTRIFCSFLYQPHWTYAILEAKKLTRTLTLSRSQAEAKTFLLFICWQSTMLSPATVTELSGAQHLPIAMDMCSMSRMLGMLENVVLLNLDLMLPIITCMLMFVCFILEYSKHREKHHLK